MNEMDWDQARIAIDDLLSKQPAPLDAAAAARYVSGHLERRKDYLRIWEEHGRKPVYALDRRSLADSAGRFRDAFASRFPEVRFYYAMKSNSHPEVSRAVLANGFGLDVSSGAELRVALDLKAKDVVFSGPGKTADELNLAAEHAGRVTVLIDSFGELERLASVAADRSRPVRAGVRLTPPLEGAWRKFGIPLSRLREFWRAAEDTPFVRLEGIQFHTSWNMAPRSQLETIEALGKELAGWPGSLRRQIRFLDVGGGFWPERGEWLQEEATERGRLHSLLASDEPHSRVAYFVPAESIGRFAESLAAAIERHLFPFVQCRICAEPGRWICNDAMHLLISVADKKEDDLVITDAGTNAIGWERFEHDYVPVVNLTRPALEERPCTIVGSLCTPHDLWGYAYWGEDIQFGDVLLVPDQGAYTFSLRQEFIKPLPKVVVAW